MKKQLYTIMAITLLVGIMSVSGRAQNSAAPHLTTNIPFEFSVGNKTMPAGEYTVSCINPASDLKVLRRARERDASDQQCQSQRPWRCKAGVQSLWQSVLLRAGVVPGRQHRHAGVEVTKRKADRSRTRSQQAVQRSGGDKSPTIVSHLHLQTSASREFNWGTRCKLINTTRRETFGLLFAVYWKAIFHFPFVIYHRLKEVNSWSDMFDEKWKMKNGK